MKSERQNARTNLINSNFESRLKSKVLIPHFPSYFQGTARVLLLSCAELSLLARAHARSVYKYTTRRPAGACCGCRGQYYVCDLKRKHHSIQERARAVVHEGPRSCCKPRAAAVAAVAAVAVVALYPCQSGWLACLECEQVRENREKKRTRESAPHTQAHTRARKLKSPLMAAAAAAAGGAACGGGGSGFKLLSE